MVGGRRIVAETKLLEHAFSLALQLPDDQQDQLAQRIIAELMEDDDFDRTIAVTAHKLDPLIAEALAEDDAGLTQEWKPLPR